MIENIKDLLNEVAGYTTGYFQIDRKVGGILPSHLYILGAETGMGKSIFAINLMLSLAKHSNITSSYFDLENGQRATAKRLVMIEGLRNKDFFIQDNEEQIKKLLEGIKENLFYRDHVKLEKNISQKSGLAMAQEIGKLIEKDSKRGAKFFVIDPLENFELGDTEYNSISKVIIYFKELAQKLDIAIFILHHLNKPTDRKTNKVNDVHAIQQSTYRIPSVHDFMGSSKIVNMATDVWALVRQKDDEEKEKRSRTLLKILKAREGYQDDPNIFLVMNLDNLKITEPGEMTAKEIFK